MGDLLAGIGNVKLKKAGDRVLAGESLEHDVSVRCIRSVKWTSKLCTAFYQLCCTFCKSVSCAALTLILTLTPNITLSSP